MKVLITLSGSGQLDSVFMRLVTLDYQIITFCSIPRIFYDSEEVLNFLMRIKYSKNLALSSFHFELSHPVKSFFEINTSENMSDYESFIRTYSRKSLNNEIHFHLEGINTSDT